MYDVIVIGAGPGGLYAATQLARRGFSVAVVEEHGEIGSPVHCTGIVATEAFLEFDLPREAVLNELKTVCFFSPGGQSITYTTEKVEAVVIDRRVFDRSLSEQAERAGTAILTRNRASAISVDNKSVTVQCASDSLRGRVCILACGANYVFQKQLGMGLPALFLHSAQLEVPAAKHGDVELYFGASVAAQGFAWAVPVLRGKEKYARIGLMCAGEAGKYFDKFLRQVSPKWGIRQSDCPIPTRKILPLGPIPVTYRNRLLSVGDAAGLVKPTTGGGIYYSIVSGATAASVLADALPSDRLDDVALQEYERSWRRKLGHELQSQLALRRLAHNLTDFDIERLFDLARSDGLMSLVRRFARFNQQRDFVLALFRHPQARQILLRKFVG